MTDEPVSLDKELFETAKAKRAGRLRPLIAIIDDDEFFCTPAVWVLNKYAHVITAENGIAGIRQYNQLAPDLVFLDINMPKMNGIETLKYILELDPMAKVVMLSARSTEENIVLARKLGAKYFITKPFSSQILQDAVQKLLAENSIPH